MSQKQIEKKGNLLTEQGILSEVGYSKNLLLSFNKDSLKSTSRLKEWDSYVIMDDSFALCLTIANLSYAGVIKASVLDFRNKQTYSRTSKIMFPKDKVFMDQNNGDGFSICTTKNAEFKFETKNGERFLIGTFKNFYKNNTYLGDLTFEIKVFKAPEESIVNAKSFKNKKHFLYTQKIIGLNAEGRVNINGRTYVFDDQLTSVSYCFARGVVPYKTDWYWATMQGKNDDGKVIGFNIGNIIDDDEESSENIIYYDGKVHKLDGSKIFIQHEGFKTNYLGTWTFYTNDGRLELFFEPRMEEKNGYNALVIRHSPHRVFGHFNGKMILDDGTEITIEHMPGVAERVENRW